MTKWKDVVAVTHKEEARGAMPQGKKKLLPCSPSLESESDQQEKTDSDIEKGGEMCGGGGDRKDKVECKAKKKQNPQG